MSLDMRDVTAIQIPVYDTHYYREVEYIQLGSNDSSGDNYIITNYTLSELLNGNTLSVTVSNLHGGIGYNGLFKIGPGAGNPYFEVGFRTFTYSDDSLGYSPYYAITTNGESTTVDTGRAMNPDDTFRVSLTLGTLGNANTTLTVVDLTTNTQIVSIDDITLPSDLSGYTSDKFKVLGMGVGGYSGIKLYAVNATINNVTYTIYPAQDKLYTNSTLASADNQFGYGAMAWDDRINDIIQLSSDSLNSHKYLGLTVNNNPGWSHTFVNTFDVTKIEDYYNGNLRQIWPCYSEGPSNPDAPLVSNAYDYDDTIVWTIGQGVQNTDSYYYYPITATGQANGVQIALADNPNGWPSDGKPSNYTPYIWYIQAERAGYYQMIMHAKLSSADHLTTGYWSNVNLYVNNSTTGVQKLNIYGQTPDLTNVDYNDVVVAIVSLTGQEDVISFMQSAYRLVIDPTSNIIFREIDGDSPARIELGTLNVQTTFTVGDTFSYSGLEVVQYLVDGTSSLISSGYTVSTPDMTTAGTKTVTVTYNGFTASYDITVNTPQAAFVVTATLTNSDSQTFEQGTINNIDAVRIPIVNYSSGSYGADGRVYSTSTDEVYKITPPSAGDYMLVLPIRRGSGNPQWIVNGGSSFSVTVTNTVFEYIEILYPITLTAGENTLTFRNSSYRCYFDTTDNVYLIKSSTNPL